MISAEVLKAPYSGSNGDHAVTPIEVIRISEDKDRPKLPLVRINSSDRCMDVLTRRVIFAEGPIWRGFIRIALATALDSEKTFSLKDMDEIAVGEGFDSIGDFPGLTLLKGVRRKIEEDSNSPQLFVTLGGWRDFSYQFKAEVQIVDRKLEEVQTKMYRAKSKFPAPDSNILADEMAIVSRVKSGDKEARGELCERYRDKLYRHFYYRVGSAEAEDLTQQVLLKAIRVIDRYIPMGKPLSSWLLRIAHNLLVDYYRAKKETASIDDVIIPTGDSADPTLLAEKDFNNHQLYQAIKRLKRDQQFVILARDIDGVAYPDIAQHMKKSEGAVRVIRHRALISLRGMLEKELFS